MKTGTVTDKQIMDFCNAKVETYKKIQFVEFTDVIPKSASGKILRKDLRTILKSRK